MTLNSIGDVYVAGRAYSPDLPGVGPGSADSTFAADPGEYYPEGFVAKLNSDLSAFLAASFLGGSKRDIAVALALDSTGNV
jgi:hypothetical protein